MHRFADRILPVQPARKTPLPNGAPSSWAGGLTGWWFISDPPRGSFSAKIGSGVVTEGVECDAGFGAAPVGRCLAPAGKGGIKSSPGNPAALSRFPPECRPVALRPSLSAGLPFSNDVFFIIYIVRSRENLSRQGCLHTGAVHEITLSMREVGSHRVFSLDLSSRMHRVQRMLNNQNMVISLNPARRRIPA